MGLRPHTIHAVLVSAISIAALTVYSAALPDITQAFWNDSDAEAALFNGVFDTIGSVVAFMILPKLGAASDVRGRKPFIFIAMVSCVMPLWMLCISETFDKDLLWFFYAARALPALPVTAFAFSYVSDVAPPSLRSRHFGYVMWGLFLGVLLGPGLYIALPGEWAFYTVGLLGALSLLYIWFIMPESLGYRDTDLAELLPPEDDELINGQGNEESIRLTQVAQGGGDKAEGDKPTDLRGVQEANVPVSQAFIYLFANKDRRPLALVYLFSSFTTRGITDIWGLYLKNSLDMTDTDLGIFTIGVGLAGGLGLGLVYPIALKCIGPVTLLKVSLSSAVFANLLVASIDKKQEINIIYLFQIFQYMVLPLCNTLLCAQVPVEDYGMALGSLGGIGQFSNAAGPALLSALYSLFASDKVGINFPKGIFLTGCALAGIATISAFFLNKNLNKRGATVISSGRDDASSDAPLLTEDAVSDK